MKNLKEIQKIEGRVYFINRPNVDTDQIIPAKYLTGVSISGLGPHLFEDLDLPGFNHRDPEFIAASVLVAQENFGCGSSREHAVWALEANGFKVVIAPSFARIFRQNMFNRGLLAIGISSDEIDDIFSDRWQHCVIDFGVMSLTFQTREKIKTYDFQLGDFEKTLVIRGGLVGFVVDRY